MLTGMEQTATDLREFEGLVVSTARLESARVHMDQEDVQQLLRIVVWKAVESYTRRRAKGTLRAYVFLCVKNRVKDMRRDAATARKHGDECFIEDVAPVGNEGGIRDRFEAEHLRAEAEAVFAVVDDRFALPSSLTERERNVVMLLALDYEVKEVAAIIGVSRSTVATTRDRVAEKMADWRPTVGTPQLAVAA